MEYSRTKSGKADGILPRMKPIPVLAVALLLCTVTGASPQSKAMMPYDHIHLIEPAAEASVWWEKNIPGGRRHPEGPDRLIYGAVRLVFQGGRATGGSQ